MSKLLEVISVNTESCIPVFYKDHTEANTTVNLKNQLHVWFTSQGLPQYYYLKQRDQFYNNSQCWLNHLNAVKKSVFLPGLQSKRFDYLF